MARSRKKTPIMGTTGNKSEKQDKRLANRRYRSRVKAAINSYDPDFVDDFPLPKLREISDIWDMNKDGKRYLDTEEYREFMRK